MTENVVLVGKLLFLVLACTLFLERSKAIGKFIKTLYINGKLSILWLIGVMCDPEEFWKWRQGPEWDDGWEIIPNPERSVG